MWPTSDMFMLFFVFSDIRDPQVKMQYYKFLFHTNSHSVTISNLFVNSKFNPFNWLEQPLNCLSINFQATTQNIVALSLTWSCSWWSSSRPLLSASSFPFSSVTSSVLIWSWSSRLSICFRSLLLSCYKHILLLAWLTSNIYS